MGRNGTKKCRLTYVSIYICIAMSLNDVAIYPLDSSVTISPLLQIYLHCILMSQQKRNTLKQQKTTRNSKHLLITENIRQMMADRQWSIVYKQATWVKVTNVCLIWLTKQMPQVFSWLLTIRLQMLQLSETYRPVAQIFLFCRIQPFFPQNIFPFCWLLGCCYTACFCLHIKIFSLH